MLPYMAYMDPVGSVVVAVVVVVVAAAVASAADSIEDFERAIRVIFAQDPRGDSTPRDLPAKRGGKLGISQD